MFTKLILGDCLEAMADLEPGSVDMVMCDPPYGTTACKWDSVVPFGPMWAHLKRVVRPNAAIVLMASQPFTSALIMSNPKWFKNEWVWDKVMKTGHLNAKVKPMRQTEDVVIFGGGRVTYNPQMTAGEQSHSEGSRSGKVGQTYAAQNIGYEDRALGDDKNLKYPSNIVRMAKVHAAKALHPTQKPVDLMAYLIRTYSNVGEVVLDFTMGSGTTGVAAVQEGRSFVGIERDEAYSEVARDRIEQAEVENDWRGLV